MGFIEDLRRQKERPTFVKVEIPVSKKNAEARKHFSLSDFPKLIEGLVEYGGYSMSALGIEDKPNAISPEVSITLTKSIVEDTDGKPGYPPFSNYLSVEERTIDVRVDHMGEIRVTGDAKLGSTELFWKGDLPGDSWKDRQEKALKKAYQNPQRRFTQTLKPGKYPYGAGGGSSSNGPGLSAQNP